MDHVALAQTPEAPFFFVHFQDSKAEWHVALGLSSVSLVRHHSVREVYVVWRLLWGP